MRALAFRHSLAREAASTHRRPGGPAGLRLPFRAVGNPAVGLAEVAQTPQVRSDNCFPYPERARPAVYGRKR
jgi:hypothetical protein